MAFEVVVSATTESGMPFRVAIHSHATVAFLGSLTLFFVGACVVTQMRFRQVPRGFKPKWGSAVGIGKGGECEATYVAVERRETDIFAVMGGFRGMGLAHLDADLQTLRKFDLNPIVSNAAQYINFKREVAAPGASATCLSSHSLHATQSCKYVFSPKKDEKKINESKGYSFVCARQGMYFPHQCRRICLE